MLETEYNSSPCLIFSLVYFVLLSQPASSVYTTFTSTAADVLLGVHNVRGALHTLSHLILTQTYKVLLLSSYYK